VRAALGRLPVVRELGTGENGMHPEFGAMLAYLRAAAEAHDHLERPLIQILDDDVTAFRTWSSPTTPREEQDGQREPGNWDLLHEQAARCRRLGVPVTFIAVMSAHRSPRRHRADRESYDAPLRINVYHGAQRRLRAQLRGVLTAFETLFARTDATSASARAGDGRPPPRARADAGGHGPVTPRDRPALRLLDRRRRLLDVLPTSAPRSWRPRRSRPRGRAGACLSRLPGDVRGRLCWPPTALDAPIGRTPIARGAWRRAPARRPHDGELPKLESACTTVVAR
jgi:hypothetical protein